MTPRFCSLSLAACAALTLAALPAVSGRPAPLPQRQLSRGAVSTARLAAGPRALHFVFGTLVAIRGSALTLRTRGGSILQVDAAAAIAAGTYSAPLFVGKVVVLGGSYEGPRTFRAQTVTRIPRLDASTGPDR
jgi:hypothetical protein